MMIRIRIAVLLVWLCFPLTIAPPSPVDAAGESDRDVRIGEPASLVVHPDAIHLSGSRAMQQIIVTGHYRNGDQRDLTPFCTFSAEDAEIVRVGPGGFLRPRKNGRTLVV